jgi:hypothetical protein
MQTNSVTSTAITTQPDNYSNNECVTKGVSMDRLCSDRCVACSFVVPSFLVAAGSGVGLHATGYGACFSVFGGCAAGLYSGVTCCTIAQAIQNCVRPCNNPYRDHKADCPHRGVRI